MSSNYFYGSSVEAKKETET